MSRRQPSKVEGAAEPASGVDTGSAGAPTTADPPAADRRYRNGTAVPHPAVPATSEPAAHRPAATEGGAGDRDGPLGAGRAAGTDAGAAPGPAGDGEPAEGSASAEGSAWAGALAAGDDGAGTDGAEPVRLPEPVRLRVVALAADALGRLPADEVPVPLRAVARFTPAKRAKLGAGALAAALDADPAFRLAVAVRADRSEPEILAAVREGAMPPAADPVELAAAAYLLRSAGWRAYLDRARVALDEAAERTRGRERAAELARLRAELAAARAGVQAELQQLQAAADAARAEADALRRQLREQTGLRRAAERTRATVEEALVEERRRAAAAESAASAEIRRLRQKLAEADDTVEAARRAARDARQADETRLWLLLDTVAGAVQGLRRELALTPTEDRPADAVAAVAPGQDQLAARGDDPGQLDRLLALPRVHLVVDGYNVTKAGYGDLPLATQRNRLIGGLGALVARTGIEVSCVFDGAARPPVAPPTPRGLRVLFSSPGEQADDLIRRLVAAEPAGRPVVVVSSDREVAESVRRTGAYPIQSALLLRRLDRG